MENSVRTNKIVSGLPDNVMDYDKINRYAKEMKQNDIETGHHGFPPITGFWGEISNHEVEIGLHWNVGKLEDSEPIRKEDIGTKVFFVTDGHHRTFAAQMVGIWCLEVEPDESGNSMKQKF